MKALIYMPFGTWQPHLATALEIIDKHTNIGDEVHIVRCSGNLSVCEINAEHAKATCDLCQKTRDKGLNLINFPDQYRHELDVNNFIRKLNMPAFSSIQELKAFEIGGIDFGMAVASTLISYLREPKPNLNQYENLVKQYIVTSVAVYNTIKCHIEVIKPDVFYLCNGRFATSRPALRVAQRLGVKTFVYEIAGVVNRYSLTEDTYSHDMEYQNKQIELCWDNTDHPVAEKEEVARQWFKERREGKDQGWYSFIKTQKKGKLPRGFNSSKRNIAIFNSSEDEFEAIAGWQNPIYKDQNDAINNIINADVDENIMFYLRVHPNLKTVDNSQTRGLLQLKAPNLAVIPAEDDIDTYALMDACEKVITFGSTTGIESIFWQKPSILVGKSVYEQLGCYNPKSHDEVIDLINGKLTLPSSIGALKYGYWQMVQGHLHTKYEPESVTTGKFLGVPLRVKGPLLNRCTGKIVELVDKGLFLCGISAVNRQKLFNVLRFIKKRITKPEFGK